MANLLVAEMGNAVRSGFLVVLSAILLGGCSSMPSFDRPVGSRPDAEGGPTVRQLVIHIQCELQTLLTQIPKLKEHAYVIAANLTLDVTNSQTFSPVLNVITPLNPASTNRTAILGGQLAGTQHRTMNLVFSFVLDSEQTTPPAGGCPTPAEGGLYGDLDLKEIVGSGLDSINGFFIRRPYDDEAATYKSAAVIPTFGSTIDFAITTSAGGGPVWNLTRFKSGSGNLLNFQRVTKDTLVIAFAQAGVHKPPTRGVDEKIQSYNAIKSGPFGPSTDLEQASKAAQDNVTRMILQRLIPQ